METIVDEPQWLRTASWLGCPLAGAAIGWFLQSIADWVVSLSWVPFKGPFQLVSDIPHPWGVVAGIGAGLVLGLLFAAVWAHERLIVKVTPTRITLTTKGRSRAFEAKLEAVFLDGKELVLLAADGRELVREKADVDRQAVATAFREYGYPWQDEPPAVK
ncbi:YqeB family protein [Amycolatopsis regifaucium]|uniref:YqeB PH domain-containing protein n=1 Tax=Amycolatopsis regifaucium TaxID=546365 RepID=A0A154ML05_9PSEU|nr:hypothetical protein [Amycolatopsis regifaucium]KZB84991.1 hypothetical protein AVL48_01930 [Amycolatopsis regifaucium]OKA04010.1 hypothetical protein ATP06_0232785 [Amycolatopsis regifaucium]